MLQKKIQENKTSAARYRGARPANKTSRTRPTEKEAIRNQGERGEAKDRHNNTKRNQSCNRQRLPNQTTVVLNISYLHQQELKYETERLQSRHDRPSMKNVR
ncbi:hypothetical protein V6N13_038382 [Hibiscus sabdariffa]